jgi:hypothetical protein
MPVWDASFAFKFLMSIENNGSTAVPCGAAIRIDRVPIYQLITAVLPTRCPMGRWPYLMANYGDMPLFVPVAYPEDLLLSSL